MTSRTQSTFVSRCGTRNYYANKFSSYHMILNSLNALKSRKGDLCEGTTMISSCSFAYVYSYLKQGYGNFPYVVRIALNTHQLV